MGRSEFIRTWRHTSHPLCSGSIISSTIKSGDSHLYYSQGFLSVYCHKHLKAFIGQKSAIICSILVSSSTTSIFLARAITPYLNYHICCAGSIFSTPGGYGPQGPAVLRLDPGSGMVKLPAAAVPAYSGAVSVPGSRVLGSSAVPRFAVTVTIGAGCGTGEVLGGSFLHVLQAVVILLLSNLVVFQGFLQAFLFLFHNSCCQFILTYVMSSRYFCQ